MNRPTAVIAEDEPLLRRELKDALARLWPELDILAEVGDGVKALQALSARTPDVLFLDIQMPGMSGIDVARAASGRCHVVFVTAYDQYAVTAFDQGAVDYVLKPFLLPRLGLAITRLRQRMNSTPRDLEALLDELGARRLSARPFLRWISVAEGRTVRLITANDICYFQADNKYTIVVTAAAQSLINKTIKELVGELDPEMFLQIHRGTVVNINAISGVHRDLRGRLSVHLKQRSEALQVSVSFAHLFKQM